MHCCSTLCSSQSFTISTVSWLVMMVSLDTNFLQKCRLFHIYPKFLDFEDNISNKSHSNEVASGHHALRVFTMLVPFLWGKG